MYTVKLYTKTGIDLGTATSMKAALFAVAKNAKDRGHAYEALKVVSVGRVMEFWAVSADEKSREMMAEIEEGD